MTPLAIMQIIPRDDIQSGNASPNAIPIKTEKIILAFRKIICRRPSVKEEKLLTDYYTAQLQLFQQKKLNAAVILQVGEYPLNKNEDAIETAALMKVINIIYNMEEAIMKT